jgi:hypothetical protein|nr:MAG TPA: hypothetical protein [Caudoviricetes sp.]
MANSLHFDIELLETDLRDTIKKNIKNKEVIEKFGEIHLVPIDSDFNSQIKIPAVWIEVQNDGPYVQAQEDIEIEPYSRFSVMLETYTNGKNRRTMNMRLARFIENILQTNQQLKNYYNRGLNLEYDRELSTPIENANRRQARLSGIVDNARKLIYNKER